VANCVDPATDRLAENIDTLRGLIGAPLLGQVPHLMHPKIPRVAKALDLDPLLGDGQ
jgi:dethiobiotin synthetase